MKQKNTAEIDQRTLRIFLDLLPVLVLIQAITGLSNLMTIEPSFKHRRDTDGRDRYKPLTYPKERRKGYL